jgi:hypothetical protein
MFPRQGQYSAAPASLGKRQHLRRALRADDLVQSVAMSGPLIRSAAMPKYDGRGLQALTADSVTLSLRIAC